MNARDPMGAVRVTVATAAAPGAVALLQLRGPGVARVLRELTGVAEWPASRLRLARFGDIDEGLAVMLREDAASGGGGWAQLMPHGGPRVVQKLLDRLRELGVAYEADPPAREAYPEAGSALEADMLAALARAASPAAIDLLLPQPRLWKAFLESSTPSEGVGNCRLPIADCRLKDRDSRAPLPIGNRKSEIGNPLDHLFNPPSVVVVGRPNVGKSTLANRVLGRAASLVADLPGTTRDWVAGLAEIGGVAVRWTDTPGLRQSDDPIERRAIELARPVIASADVLVVMRDPRTPWPELDRRPDVRVVNKIDLGAAATEDGDPPPVKISAISGEGVDRLEAAVLAALGLTREALRPAPWAFSPRLRELIGTDDWPGLAEYVGR